MRRFVPRSPLRSPRPRARTHQKKVLTQADWDKWKSINAPALSPDGKWAVYTLIPQVGDGELVIRSTGSHSNTGCREATSAARQHPWRSAWSGRRRHARRGWTCWTDGFGDQFFADIRTIGISRVDEVDSQLDGTAKDGNRCRGILRRPPDSVARQAHGPEAKAVDGEFIT